MSLPSWSNTPTKQAILDFVAAVTRQNGPNYVPPAEQIAADEEVAAAVQEFVEIEEVTL